MERKKKKKGFRFKMPSAFTVLLIIIVVLALVTYLIPSVKNASLPLVLMSPVKGFADALDVCIFVIVIGGFLGVVTKTRALEAGVAKIVEKMKGKEIWMIPVLMILFSLGGTTYGMAEETIAFYALITATMMAAGFDSLVGASVILLGAGVGVLGSTVNPFAVSVAVDAFQSAFPGVVVNQSIVIALGAILWITSLVIAIIFVMRYAKKVQHKKEASILSEKEQRASERAFLKKNEKEPAQLTGRRKAILVLFGISFVIMIISLIPWSSFGITIFEKSTAWFLGVPFGDWYFQELAAWFFLVSIIIGIIDGLKEKEIVDSFVEGASGMISVALIIAVSRGISVLMAETGLSTYILTHAADALRGVSTGLFTGLSYLVYVGLSFLIPSTSGLATASIPTMGGLAYLLKLSPEVMIMVFCAACGLVNLFTPTSAVVMGGLEVSKIEFGTWLKFVFKLLLILLVVNIVILTIAMFLF